MYRLVLASPTKVLHAPHDEGPVIEVENEVVIDVRDVSVKAALEVGDDYACKSEETNALVEEHNFVFGAVADVVRNAEIFGTSLHQVTGIGGLIQVIGLSIHEVPSSSSL